MILLPRPAKLATWWFVLGREPLLSSAEIGVILHQPIDPNCFFDLSTKHTLRIMVALNPEDIIHRVGGTIKIGREIVSSLTEADLMSTMVRRLSDVPHKINFGISLDTQNTSAATLVEEWGKKIKEQLKNKGRSVRYVFGGEATLSSATVVHNHLLTRGREFLVASAPSGFALAETTAVQPFEEFGARDYGRPGRDDASGMLPPKLAMMMINLAVASLPHCQMSNVKCQILDPFCGSGTILTEAAILGYHNLIGADLSDKAVEDTKKNIAWTEQNNSNLKSKILNLKLFQSDVRMLSEKIPASSVDAIVTESYLGPPLTGQETAERLQHNCRELVTLYQAAFAEFKKILKPHGVVVFIIPRFVGRSAWHTISDKLIPQIRSLGFKKIRFLPTELTPTTYLLYHRPAQLVGREIWKFTL